MRIDSNNPRHIIADEGYEFQRKATGERLGSELWLGISHYIGGVRQDPPHQDTAEDFVEIALEVPVEKDSGELAEAKRRKIAALESYDASDAVNSFIWQNKVLWLDPLTRANYLNTIQGAQRLGVSEVSFLGQKIAVEQAIQMLDRINLYAMQCVAVTENHRDNIERLTTVHDVENYNFTQGYPEKIRI